MICPPSCLGSSQQPEDYSLDEEENVPEEFVCPITACVMKDPVVLLTGAGVSYEKWALEKWLSKNPRRDPCTGKDHRANLRYLQNRSLKASIDRWRKGMMAKRPRGFFGGVRADKRTKAEGARPLCACFIFPASCHCHTNY